MEIYSDTGKLLAIVLAPDPTEAGIRFVTPGNLSMQMAFMRHPAGETVPAHTHSPWMRQVNYTVEVLVVLKGEIEVTLYGVLETVRVVIKAGQAIMLLSGHGIKVSEDAEIIEVKQGPYKDDKVFTESRNAPSIRAQMG
jgi:hypothetical protein